MEVPIWVTTIVGMCYGYSCFARPYKIRIQKLPDAWLIDIIEPTINRQIKVEEQC